MTSSQGIFINFLFENVHKNIAIICINHQKAAHWLLQFKFLCYSWSYLTFFLISFIRFIHVFFGTDSCSTCTQSENQQGGCRWQLQCINVRLSAFCWQTDTRTLNCLEFCKIWQNYKNTLKITFIRKRSFSRHFLLLILIVFYDLLISLRGSNDLIIFIIFFNFSFLKSIAK